MNKKTFRLGFVVLGVLLIGVLISRLPWTQSLIFSNDSEIRDYAAPANTAFNDSALYECVVNAYNAEFGTTYPVDNYIGPTSLANLTTLNCKDKGISDLAGLESLTGLTSLNLDGNNITSIDVSIYPSLKVLSVKNNDLVSITLHSGITDLDISGNALSSLNLTKLSTLKNLYAGGNLFTSINLSGNTMLETLNVQNGKLTSIDISENTQLKDVNLKNNALTSLSINHNQLTDLEASNNALTSFTVTSAKKLNTLQLNDNKLSSVSVNGLTTLSVLALSENKLTSINVSALTNLNQLYVASNKLTTLDVSKNTALDSLSIGGNPFAVTKVAYKGETIDLSGSTFVKLPSGYKSSVTKIDNNPYSLNGNKLTLNVGGTKEVTIQMSHNVSNMLNAYTGILNVSVVELTSTKYSIDHANNFIFTGTVTDTNTIKSNLSVNMGSITVEDGKVKVTYNGNVVKTYTIVNYSSSTYDLTKEYIYTGTTAFDLSKVNVTGGSKAVVDNKLVISYSGIALKQIPIITLSSTKYNLANDYILTGGKDYTDGISAPNATVTTDNNKVVIKYGSTILKEYVISDFVDQNFYNCVVDLYNSNNNASKAYTAVLSDTELGKIGNSLVCTQKGIKDVTGINKLSGLTTVNLSNNEISKIDVSKFTDLQTLILNDNDLSSLDVTKLTKLQVLNVANNDIPNLDLSKNTSLTELNISNNSFSSLNIKQLTKLTKLSIDGNPFVEAVTGMIGQTVEIGKTVVVPEHLNYSAPVYASNDSVTIDGLKATPNKAGNIKIIGTSASGYKITTTITVLADKLIFKDAVKPDGDIIVLNPNTSVKSVLSGIDTNGTVKVYNKENTLIDGEKYIGTESIIKITFTDSKNEYTYKVAVKGDLTGDGVVKINDVSRIYHTLKKKIELNALELLAGDTDKDNAVKINDVTKIYQFMKKKINSL